MQTIENNERASEIKRKKSREQRCEIAAKCTWKSSGCLCATALLCCSFIFSVGNDLYKERQRRSRRSEKKRPPPPPSKWMQATEWWWASWPWHFLPFHHLAFFSLSFFVFFSSLWFLVCNRKWSCRLKEEKKPKTKEIIAKCYKIFRNKTQRRTFFPLLFRIKR